MKDDRTIIISCAGMGTRLGLGKPKALIDVGGKPLIIRTLEMLKDYSDIRIVVGYKAEEVIELVTSYRKDVLFVFNHNYMNNGTGASVCLAKKYSRKYILTIDGDIIIHPDDMRKILECDHEFVGVCEISTDDPVLTKTENGEVMGFSRREGEYEWTGVTMIESKKVKEVDGHVYKFVEPLLPLKYEIIREKEIDTPNDYTNAIIWVENEYKE